MPQLVGSNVCLSRPQTLLDSALACPTTQQAALTCAGSLHLLCGACMRASSWAPTVAGTLP